MTPADHQSPLQKKPSAVSLRAEKAACGFAHPVYYLSGNIQSLIVLRYC